jgi:hypothetical protein
MRTWCWRGTNIPTNGSRRKTLTVERIRNMASAKLWWGTGGRSHDLLGFATPNSEVRNWDTFGVLKLALSPESYTWEFIPEAGKDFRDSGSGTCHNQPL